MTGRDCQNEVFEPIDATPEELAKAIFSLDPNDFPDDFMDEPGVDARDDA